MALASFESDYTARSRWLRLPIDIPLLLALIMAALVGLMVLYSASRSGVSGLHDLALLRGQIMRLGVAFAVMLVVAQIHPKQLREWTPWIFLTGIVLLIAVLLVGETSKGAQRWLDVGIRFQPAELMKVALPMMVAWYLADKPLPLGFQHLVVSVILIGVPFLLIVKQPDLGTALVVGCAGAFALFLGGLSLWIMVTTGVLIAASAPLFWWFGMKEYQRQRVLTFLDPQSDPLGASYNIIQSQIAIGSGGLYGKGWLQGTQGHLDFLPESSTDFILAVFAEEFGLIGLVLFLLLYFFIVCRGLYIATQAREAYDRILAGSLVLSFFVYVLINAGMVSGMLPVVGLPMPLMSYGGTALVTIMASFGIVMGTLHRSSAPASG